MDSSFLKKVGIRVYPYADSKGEPVQWPEDWPGLKDPATKKRKDDSLRSSYDIYLDGANRSHLEQMLSSLKEKQAVLIDQKQWYIAPSRYILPSEEVWDTERSEGSWDSIFRSGSY